MTSKAEKLLERMRRTKANWQRRDLENLLFGYGFQRRHGGNHDVFTHPDLTGAQFVLPRHGTVKKAYISKAVRLIDKLSK